MASKVNLIFVSIILLSLLFTYVVARPMRELPVPDTSPNESDQAQMDDHGFGETDRFVVDENSMKCNNGDGEDVDEECLMRRTLIAHVDYIYTQKDKKP